MVQNAQCVVQPKTLKWSNITTVGMKNILRSIILKEQLRKGILRCKNGRLSVVKETAKRSYKMGAHYLLNCLFLLVADCEQEPDSKSNEHMHEVRELVFFFQK